MFGSASLKSRFNSFGFIHASSDGAMFSVSSLQNQGTPTTLIAVCGATGAGKSSILNAVLDGESMICM